MDAVHAEGSYIVLQLWALGRAANTDVLENEDPSSPYVSASSIPLTGKSKLPRALTEAETEDYIAGFDGVEIHGANGYHVDQFLQTTSNQRMDRWGGAEEGWMQFAREIIDAVVDAVGPEQVGIHISPWSSFQGEPLRLDLHLLLC